MKRSFALIILCACTMISGAEKSLAKCVADKKCFNGPGLDHLMGRDLAGAMRETRGWQEAADRQGAEKKAVVAAQGGVASQSMSVAAPAGNGHEASKTSNSRPSKVEYHYVNGKKVEYIRR